MSVYYQLYHFTINKFYLSTITRLQRENEEQNQTILNLCESLHFPPVNKWLLQETNQFSMKSQLQNIYEQCQNNNYACNSQETSDLQAILKQRVYELETKKKQVITYIQKAQEYEAEQVKNETENARLLSDYQKEKISQHSSLPELELQISELTKENYILKQSQKEIRDQLKCTRDKIVENHNKTKELQITLNGVKERLNFKDEQNQSEMIDILSRKKDVLLALHSKIHELDRAIVHYFDDNNILKTALSSSNSA